MSRNPLKHIITHQAQTLEHDFIALTNTTTTWNDLQRRSIEIIEINIKRLITIIEALPSHNEPLSHDIRHDLRNRLTVIIGYAQLMLHRRAGVLPIDGAVFLQKIIIMSAHINTAIDHDKYQAQNGQ